MQGSCDNLFASAGKGVHLWKIPQDRGPNNPKRRNHSRDARIFRNEIRRCSEAAIFLAQTQDAVIRENRFSRNGTVLVVEAGSSGTRFQGNHIELESPRPENLAARGVASASCSPETAARAIDGVCRGDDHAWAPGHVNVGDWFQVDLGKVREVDSVVLFPRDGNGIRDDLVQLSVGCEAAEDLRDDLDRALEAACAVAAAR